MWTRKLLKQNAKVAFRRNFWLCVAVSLIAMLLGASSTGSKVEFTYEVSETEYGSQYDDLDAILGEDATDDNMDIFYDFMFSSIPILIVMMVIIIIVVIVFVILVSNIINIGHKRFYLENREHKTKIAKVFYGFTGGRYANNVWVMFCRDLYILGWSMLFVVPGLIKSFSYMMIPYILAENPEISKTRAFEISRQMMNGHKWDAFVLGLSFIGWQLLTTITPLGIAGILWTGPYMDATYAEFYVALKAEAFQKGITDSTELPGVSYPEFV